MSVADKPSEFLKRTCLICGCNTNQTINIYEPRSGPNIVELIQAKFKFQPLNEDKYLCFSCNNWLINWHSLQANNSNDAESPSGTFRSSQVNGGMAQEKRAASETLSQQQHQQPECHHKQQNNCRPVAHVRPRQLSQVSTTEKASEMENLTTLQPTEAHSNKFATTLPPKIHSKRFYAKRSKRSTFRLRRSGMKQLNACYVCRRSIVVCFRGTFGFSNRIPKPKRAVKCRKCRSVCQWRSIYMSSSLTKDHTNRNITPTVYSTSTIPPVNLVNQQKTEFVIDIQRQQQQCLERPLVDGKIVAMLRRLGTTLSRESSINNINTIQRRTQLPPIMSPAKSKPRWTRPLEADEILLHFETTISEVLPFVEEVKILTKPNRALTRRKLTYQLSDMCEEENILNSLPKELNASLISN